MPRIDSPCPPKPRLVEGNHSTDAAYTFSGAREAGVPPVQTNERASAAEVRPAPPTDVQPAPTLREVFEGHQNYVYRTLAQLGVADSDLEDLTQEVFITIHRKLAEFEWRSRLRTWIYGICLRRAADYRRSGYIRRERVHAHPGIEDATSESALPIARVERQAALQALLDAVDPDKRQILVLYEIEGLSMKEAADALGCPLQTAYTRLYAAREQLLAAFAVQKARDGRA